MNAAARALHQTNLFQGDFSSVNFVKRHSLMIFLWMIVSGSALSIIYLRHIERQYIGQLEKVEAKLTKAKLIEGQLLLEKSMWTSPSRINKIASEQLNMLPARSKAVIYIKHKKYSRLSNQYTLIKNIYWGAKEFNTKRNIV